MVQKSPNSVTLLKTVSPSIAKKAKYLINYFLISLASERQKIVFYMLHMYVHSQGDQIGRIFSYWTIVFPSHIYVRISL
jgi:hypothetical protein